MVEKNKNGRAYTRRYMAFDPGIANTGWAYIDYEMQPKHRCGVWFNVIETSKDAGQQARLACIYAKVNELLCKIKPDLVVMELAYGGRPTVAIINMVRGVIKLACEEHGVFCVDMRPQDVKKGVVGYYSRVKKPQVKEAVRKKLGFVTSIKNEHMADALAMILAHVEPVPACDPPKRRAISKKQRTLKVSTNDNEGQKSKRKSRSKKGKI